MNDIKAKMVHVGVASPEEAVEKLYRIAIEDNNARSMPHPPMLTNQLRSLIQTVENYEDYLQVHFEVSSRAKYERRDSMDSYQRDTARTDNGEHPVIYYAACLAEELGEVISLVKKRDYHGHDIKKEQFKKELGDLHWYLARLEAHLGLKPSDVCSANIEKLRIRYPNGFSSEDSIKRVDQESRVKPFQGGPGVDTSGMNPTSKDVLDHSK